MPQSKSEIRRLKSYDLSYFMDSLEKFLAEMKQIKNYNERSLATYEGICNNINYYMEATNHDKSINVEQVKVMCDRADYNGNFIYNLSKDIVDFIWSQ